MGRSKADLATSGNGRRGRMGGNHSSPCQLALDLGRLIESNKHDLTTAVGLLAFMPLGVYSTA
jgi:hypothetical protein